MKKIEELYQEILQDEGLKAEFVQAAKNNQLEAFLQKNDCNDTPAELQEFAEKKQSEVGLLSDSELDAAAGGTAEVEVLLSIVTFGFWCASAADESARTKKAKPREGNDSLFCRG